VKLWRFDGMFWLEITGDLAALHSQYHYINDIWVSPDDANTLLVATSTSVP